MREWRDFGATVETDAVSSRRNAVANLIEMRPAPVHSYQNQIELLVNSDRSALETVARQMTKAGETAISKVDCLAGIRGKGRQIRWYLYLEPRAAQNTRA